jgi:hypothetical protein
MAGAAVEPGALTRGRRCQVGGGGWRRELGLHESQTCKFMFKKYLEEDIRFLGRCLPVRDVEMRRLLTTAARRRGPDACFFSFSSLLGLRTILDRAVFLPTTHLCLCLLINDWAKFRPYSLACGLEYGCHTRFWNKTKCIPYMYAMIKFHTYSNS